MRSDKEKAFELRRSGMSYKKISQEIGTPTATLSDWFRNEPWSIEIRDRLAGIASLSNPNKLELMVAATKKKFALLHEDYRREAIEEFKEKKSDPLFIAGLMLYWGEGDKNVANSTIHLSNSEQGMIRVFYIFLVNAMGIPPEKIAFNLLLYPDLVDTVQRKSWSMATGIPLAQFRKSVFINGRHPTKRLSHGVGMIRTGGRKHKEKLIKWIELAMRDFGNQVIA